MYTIILQSQNKLFHFPSLYWIGVETDKHDLFDNKGQKCIGRFFYENGIDSSVVDSPSFKEMMTESGCQKIPDSHDLDGWMLQEALKEVQDHVKKVKDSWAVTGCSLLLDAWVDQKGRDLVSFIADCPAGPVYLISFDVTDIKNDVHALTSLVDELVEEVGVHNVIQIIASSSSGWVGELGKSFAANNNKVFWSGKDCFNEASQADQISNISPGASRYKLKRRLAEKLLLNEGRSRGEEQHLEELAFVHYNLHLQSCKAKSK